ncbi:copper transporter [Nocardiopsis ansamitocini]|uniref:Copper transport outer membrane protein MctB n=1 Tax=Nocardiopsis ansamitocini TaxID=1670832 RepID=A0A9W6P8A2_9ACTN|nr:copper transporter [Nocardiopsis ansamitocini]GLU49390.1 hypothetical protein Nans01_37410 [Nocardiopsis ansamitocini]
MIDFRYHLVSIVAVFLALTVGIVLGTTMLQDPLLNTLKAETTQLREQSEQLRTEKDLADQLNTGSDALVAAYADDMLADRLADRRVLVVEAPGVEPELRDALIEEIKRADGTVSGQLAFTAQYLEPGQATFVNELTDQLSDGLELPRGNPYERAGAELAQAVVDGDKDVPDGVAVRTGDSFDGEAVLAGFTEAGLLSVQGSPASPADLVLVIAPTEPFPLAEGQEDDGEAVTPPGNAAMLALARAFSQAGGGVVLAGPPSADGPDGMVQQARAEDVRFSTVDNAGAATGNVVAVLALAAEAEGRRGHYGVGAASDGYLPDPLPEAQPEAAPSPSPSPADRADS